MAAIAAEMRAGVGVTELGFCAGDPQPVIALLAAALAYDPEALPGDAEAFASDLSNSLLETAGTPGQSRVSNHK